MSMETSETTILPITLDLVDEELKEWAIKVEVDVEPVDGVWWHCGNREDALRQVQEGTGWLGLQFHGGGYVIGSAKDVRSGGSRIPRGLIKNGICSCLLALEYSLVNTSKSGDEESHSFPLQILEALSAYQHLTQTMTIPPKRIILIGDSAGGHLALALQRYLLQSSTNKPPSPGGMILLSPWCDLSIESQIPHVQRLLGPLPPERLHDSYFSPALHSPPAQWPPTLVYYGANERFASSITVLASRLAEGGASITTYTSEKIPDRFAHDFLLFVSVESAWPEEVRVCWTRIKAWVDGLESGRFE